MFPTEFLERLPLMGGGVIELNNDRAALVPQQLTEKHTDLLLSLVVDEEEIVETDSSANTIWAPSRVAFFLPEARRSVSSV